MISKVKIKNYKSIVDMDFELGQFNVIVGANGCGKTNILEAIAFASASNQEKLDNEFLSSRMRLTDPDFMCAEFENEDLSDITQSSINIEITTSDYKSTYCYLSYNESTNVWGDWFGNIMKDMHTENFIERAAKDNSTIMSVIKDLAQKLDNINNFEKIKKTDLEIFTYEPKLPKTFNHIKKIIHNRPSLDSFIIYSPEESNLRKFSDETQIRPLGRRGEGMFRHLKELLLKEDRAEILTALNEGLSLLDWFKKFDIPSDLFTNENRLDIEDKYLKETKSLFDQQSTNEGFLFLLFYLTLFNSPKTPEFFAIDNIETALNPKLTKKLIELLVQTAKRKNKQVIITTHSPYVLDGIDLSDDAQRLFVVDRNIDGHTRINRIPHRKNRNRPLSEIWMSGVLGGLPDNF